MILLYPFDFLARSEAFFETILPALFFFRSDFLRPPEVFSLVPLKTEDLPRLPLAMVGLLEAAGGLLLGALEDGGLTTLVLGDDGLLHGHFHGSHLHHLGHL